MDNSVLKKLAASEAYKDHSLEAHLDKDFIYGSLSTEVEALAGMGSKYNVGVRRLLIKQHKESCHIIEEQLKDSNFVHNTDSDDSLLEEWDSSINQISVELPEKGKKNTISRTEVKGKKLNPAVCPDKSQRLCAEEVVIPVFGSLWW